MIRIINFLKKEPVLVISWILAICSMLVIVPDKQYIEYIDMRTILLLLCLMLVMAGFKEAGVFKSIGAGLLNRVSTRRQLYAVLIFLPFFSGMAITNDVALITFVPFAMEILAMAALEKDLIFVVAMQTVAANLGSILLPIGNPQNIYLYSIGGYSMGEFIMLMLPYTVVSFLLLCIFIFMKKDNHKLDIQVAPEKTDKKSIIMYCILFAVCLMVVANMISIYLMLAVVLLMILIFDKKVLKKADYALLLTFIGFFVFVGNISRIPSFEIMVKKVTEGHEVLASLLISQVISNVPAALLLSGFCEKTNELLIGVNIGGLGTLIASMASLISYKYIAVNNPEIKGKYFAYFTVINIIFLAVLLILYMLSVRI